MGKIIYNGMKFESQLAARRAVFFDNANIKYQHKEKCDGVLENNGVKWLPDFYLTDHEIFCEVIPCDTNRCSEIIEIIKVIWDTSITVIILPEIPKLCDVPEYFYKTLYFDSQFRMPVFTHTTISEINGKVIFAPEIISGADEGGDYLHKPFVFAVVQKTRDDVFTPVIPKWKAVHYEKRLCPDDKDHPGSLFNFKDGDKTLLKQSYRAAIQARFKVEGRGHEKRDKI